MSVEFLLKNVEAFEAVLANRNKFSVKSLKAVERAAFGHGQNFVDAKRIAKTRKLGSLRMAEGFCNLRVWLRQNALVGKEHAQPSSAQLMLGSVCACLRL